MVIDKDLTPSTQRSCSLAKTKFLRKEMGFSVCVSDWAYQLEVVPCGGFLEENDFLERRAVFIYFRYSHFHYCWGLPLTTHRRKLKSVAHPTHTIESSFPRTTHTFVLWN
jgi:hypothetical protein